MRLKVKIDFEKEPEVREEVEQMIIYGLNKIKKLPDYNISYNWKKTKNYKKGISKDMYAR